MDADLRSAASMSHLRELPPEVLDNLLVGSVRLTQEQGVEPRFLTAVWLAADTTAHEGHKTV
jgi:hypothetical protein